MAFFAVEGLRTQARALRSGGPVVLPDVRALSWSDPTDCPERSRPRLGAGARRLAAAVLQSAFHDLSSYPPDSAISRQALRWIFTDDRGPYSFEALCEALDFDVAALRRVAAQSTPAGPLRPVPRHIATR